MECRCTTILQYEFSVSYMNVEDRHDGARVVRQVSGRVRAQERQRAARAPVRRQRSRGGRGLPALALPVLSQAAVAVGVQIRQHLLNACYIPVYSQGVP